MINFDSRLYEIATPNELFLIGYFGNMMDESRLCYPGNKKICRDLKISLPTLQSIKKSCIQKNLIEVRTRHKDKDPGQTSNYYFIKTPLVSNYTHTKKLDRGDIKEVDSPPVKELSMADGNNFSTAPAKKLSNEVLEDEELNNEVLTIEELEKERENNYLLLSHYDILNELISNIYPHLEDLDYNILEKNDHLKIKDPNTQNLLKKIRLAAENLHSAFTELKQPIPAWRNWQSTYNHQKEGKPNPKQDAIDQLQSYAEFCRVTKTYLTTDPEKLPEKILMADWCTRLKDYADDAFPHKYDPMGADYDFCPDWLMWYFYEERMFYVDRQNPKRMF